MLAAFPGLAQESDSSHHEYRRNPRLVYKPGDAWRVTDHWTLGLFAAGVLRQNGDFADAVRALSVPEFKASLSAARQSELEAAFGEFKRAIFHSAQIPPHLISQIRFSSFLKSGDSHLYMNVLLGDGRTITELKFSRFGEFIGATDSDWWPRFRMEEHQKTGSDKMDPEAMLISELKELAEQVTPGKSRYGNRDLEGQVEYLSRQLLLDSQKGSPKPTSPFWDLYNRHEQLSSRFIDGRRFGHQSTLIEFKTRKTGRFVGTVGFHFDPRNNSIRRINATLSDQGNAIKLLNDIRSEAGLPLLRTK